MCPSVTVFGFTFYPYSLCMVTGAGCAIALFLFRIIRGRVGGRDERFYAVQTLIIAMAAGIPAAMLADSLFKWWETGEFRLQGATFYGGAIFGCAAWAAMLAARRQRSVPVLGWFDALAPCIAAGHAIGRVGCFLGGCCYGLPTDLPVGVVFPEGSLPYAQYGSTPLHPTQLYEAAFLLLIFFLLMTMPQKGAFARYLILYGAGRFLIEFLRADDRGSLPLCPFFTPAQGISLVLILIGAVSLAASCHPLKRRS